ncbi:hypothetical protein ACS0TY_002650 [Phlomoides rotata]
MQRERSGLNSFPEPIDLNQGSLPDNTSMDHEASWNNRLNPVENQYMLGGTDGNVSCINTAFEPSNITSSYVGNQMNSSSLSMQNQSSNRGSLNLNLNHGYSWDHDIHRSSGASLPHNIYKSGHPEIEQVPTLYASSSNVGSCSGSSSTSSENLDAPGPSFGTWGSSCKRKALEGTSGQFYSSGSSSSNQPMGKGIMQHPVPGCYSASGTLSISSGHPSLSPLEQINPSSGVGMSRVAPGHLSSSSVPGVVPTSARTYNTRLHHGRHESVPFGTSRSTSVRNSSGVYAAQLSLPITNIDSSELRSQITLPVIQPSNLNQPQVMHSNEARGAHVYPLNRPFSSRGGSSSSSFMVSGDGGSETHEEVNVRSSRRNNLEYPMTVSAPETRNVLQDQIDWSFAPGASASSRNHSSGSRVGPSGVGRTYSSAWLPHQVQTTQNHQRSTESFPWIPFNQIDPEPGTRRSHFPLSPSPEEAPSTSQAHHQLDQRSAAFLMDMAGDDSNGWSERSAVESRHRLIRQLLTAMRRGVHLPAEDYMLIDPFINGFAELHDRHRDMRLDVDNMSYEELLALEERIGSVNTGLSEEKIRGSMKQRKFEAIRVFQNLEPCCICQEDYVTGEDIGILDCGHEFHTRCIKQWLTLKNLCPICKTTALAT